MSLARRTRAVAVAGQPREFRTTLAAVAGVAGLAAGLSTDAAYLAVAGGTALGIALGTLFSNADRSYLEGFSDGLVYAATDEDADPARVAATGHGGGNQPDLRGLPGRAGADVGRPAPGGTDPDQRGAGSATDDGAGIDPGLRAAFGLPREPGPRAAPLDRVGSPIVAAQGPRGSGFPAIPAAQPAGSPRSITEVGAAPRRKARRGFRPFTVKE